MSENFPHQHNQEQEPTPGPIGWDDFDSAVSAAWDGFDNAAAPVDDDTTRDDGGPVPLNFLDNFRPPEERGPMVTPEEYNKYWASQEVSLQGEQQGEDAAFKDRMRSVIAQYVGDDRPLVAYNPGCGTHVSMAEVLPEGSRAIFVDSDGDVVHAFAQRNANTEDKPRYEVYQDEMEHFRLPDNLRADLVLIYNAGHMTPESLDEIVKPGGIVVVNEWHGAASYMREHCPNYQHAGMVEAEDSTLDLHVFRRQSEENEPQMVY